MNKPEKIVLWFMVFPAACLGAVVGFSAGGAFVLLYRFICRVDWMRYSECCAPSELKFNVFISATVALSAYLFVEFGAATAPRRSVGVSATMYLVGASVVSTKYVVSYPFLTDHVASAVLAYVSAAIAGAVPIFSDKWGMPFFTRLRRKRNK